MRFLVDNAIGVSVAAGLRVAGHDAVHVRDRGLSSAADDVVFRLAELEGRTIISADADFSYLLAVAGRSKPSFLLLRFADRRSEIVLRILLANLEPLADDIEAGCIAVFEDERIRIRRLPL